MSFESSIEWTDATWNPVRGCTKISPGCKRCYAETFAERFRGVKGHPYEQGFDLRLVPEKLGDPLRWRLPKMVFVNSMSDLFQAGVSDDYIVSVAQVMAHANWHTFQVLTKRADRLRKLLSTKLRRFASEPHIWWGVSVENRKYGLPRIDHLRSAPSVVRFLSVEPLLEDLGQLNLNGIDWVIVGGESGPGARLMIKTGYCLSKISAARHVSPSSSNSGAEFGKRLPADCWRGVLTTNFPQEGNARRCQMRGSASRLLRKLRLRTHLIR